MRRIHVSQGTENASKKWFVRFCLVFGVLYLFLMIGVTIYAQTIYVQRLPAVRITNPQAGEISYVLKEEAVITEDGAVIHLDLSNRIFPVRILQPGCPIALTVNGTMFSGSLQQMEEQSDNKYQLILTVDTVELQPGAMAEIEIICEPASFQYIIERSLIHKNMDEKDVIYLVIQQDGPWGKQYVLKEEQVYFWPEEDSETVALMLSKPPSYPIANTVNDDLFLYAGMEVQLVS